MSAVDACFLRLAAAGRQAYADLSLHLWGNGAHGSTEEDEAERRFVLGQGKLGERLSALHRRHKISEADRPPRREVR
jgi:hypothetical protein